VSFDVRWEDEGWKGRGALEGVSGRGQMRKMEGPVPHQKTNCTRSRKLTASPGGGDDRPTTSSPRKQEKGGHKLRG
jgi:hypothetical protein